MANKITFLGTAGDSYVAGKQIRSSGGIILRIDDIQFHIDPGPGAVVNATQNHINLRANTAVMVSNSGILHSNDANAVIDAMTYGGIDKKGLLISNKTYVNGAEGIYPGLTNLHKSFVEKVIVLEKGHKLGIEHIEIIALPTINNDPNAIGFKFLTPDFTLVYSSDTKYSRDIVKEYKGADILILNVLQPGEKKVEYQLNSEDTAKIINDVKPKLAIITHFGINMVKGDPLYEGREMQKKTNVQVLVAKDGMSITPGSYAARSNQKRLNTFENSEKKTDVVEEHLHEEEVKAESHEEHQEHLD